MGRPRKPTALRLLEGRRGKDKLLATVEAPLGVPRPPAHLKGLARKLWNHLAPQLDALRLLSRIDGPNLEGLCVAYARAVGADLVIAEHGVTVDVSTDAGHIVRRVRPEVQVSKDS